MMKHILKKLRRQQEGMLAIEACFSLLTFLVLMLALYSLITLFMAQSMISYAMSQASQSMALESYTTAQLRNGKPEVGDVMRGFVQIVDGAVASGSNQGALEYYADGEYISEDRWFDTRFVNEFDTAQVTAANAQVAQVAKARFATYLAGGEAAADELLEKLGVQNGLDGMDFTGTQLSGKDLTIAATYKIDLLIRVERFGLGTFETGQSVTAKMWGSMG